MQSALRPLTLTAFCTLCLVSPAQAQQPVKSDLPAGAVAKLGSANLWHGNAIRAVAFAPGDKVVASLGNDGKLIIWDADTGKPLHRLTLTSKRIFKNVAFAYATMNGPAILFSGDAKVVAAIDQSGRECSLWDVARGVLLHQVPLPTHEEEMELPAGVVFGPGAQRPKRHVSGPVAISPDGKLLAMAFAKDNTIHLIEPGQKEPSHRLQGHEGRINAMVFSPDGKMLLSGGDDQSVRLWDVAKGKAIYTFTGHRAAIGDLAFAADGKHFVSGAMDGTLRLWDRFQERSLAQIPWKPAALQEIPIDYNYSNLSIGIALQRVWFEEDGKQVGCQFAVSAGSYGSLAKETLLRFDAATGKKLSHQQFYVPPSTPMYVSAWGQRAAVTAGVSAIGPSRRLVARGTASFHVQMSSTTNGELPPTTTHLGTGCAEVEMARDQVAFVRQGDSGIYLWNWRQPSEPRRLTGHTAPPFLAGFTPGGQRLLSATREPSDRSLSVWDVDKGEESRNIAGWNPGIGAPKHNYVTQGSTPAGLQTPQLSPDGRLLALRGRDGQLRVVNLATGADVAKFNFAWKGEGSLAFTPDGQRLVVGDAAEERKFMPAGGMERTVSCFLRLFEVASGKELRLVNGASYEFLIASLAVTGRHALAGCKDGALLVIDLENGRSLRELVPPKPNPNKNNPGFVDYGPTPNDTPFFVLSPDRKMLALRAPESNTIKLIEIATAKERHQFKGHEGPITAARFSADGNHLITGSRDGTILVWSLFSTTPVKVALDSDTAWKGLADDAGPAFQAMRQLSGQPEAALKLFQDRLKLAVLPPPEQIQQWLKDLDSESFPTRNKAHKELARLGSVVRTDLEKTGSNPNASSEVKTRVKTLLNQLDQTLVAPEAIRPIRAVEVLEHLGTDAARKVLQNLAEGPANHPLTLEAGAALQRRKVIGNP